MQCPFCEGEIGDAARKCRHCGEWVGFATEAQTAKSSAQPVAKHSSAPAVEGKGSVLFAVITFIFYVLFYPLGVLLNLIGLFTGPKKGCFVSMFLLLCLLPIGAMTVFVVTGAAVGIAVVDDNIARVKQFLGKGGPTTSSGSGSSQEGKDAYAGAWHGTFRPDGYNVQHALEVEYVPGTKGGRFKFAAYPWQDFTELAQGRDPGRNYALQNGDQFSFEVKSRTGRLRYYANGDKIEVDMQRTR